jgi:two-component system response regulator HupR/HoxA
VRDAITRFARLDAPVLITGETGTGKELVARALHQASDHRDRPFTPVNCGSIAEALLESEMFGHEKGAFTGADKASKGLFDETGQGTIFLDEIGDISPRLQSALLRVLETGEIRAVGSARTRSIHCRVIAATNADLDAMSEQGKFRRDLLYRIQRLCIHVPPLRERRDDILLLARHFLDLGRRIGVHAALSRDLVETLRAYDWPGNVRELRNVIERMRLMHSDKLYYAIEDLDLKFHAFGAAVRRESESPAPARPVETPPSPAAAAPPLPTDASPLDQGPAATESPALEAILLSGRSQVRRLDRLRALFRQHRKLMRSEVIQVLDVSPNTATKDLKALCDEGFIDRVEPSASSRSHYFVLRDTAPGAASPPPA